MATAYSQPLQYTPYQEQFNKELLAKALAYKQDKYDTNRQQIKNTIAQVSNIDLIKDQDAEYLHDRMQTVINTLNTQGAGDLSLDSRTDYLTGYVADLADQRVMNGYLGTRAYRNVQSEYEAAKEKGEDSAENLAYSLRDINAWVGDGQVGSALPAGANTYYVPFVDKMSNLQEVAEGLEANSVVSFDPFGTSGYTWISQSGEVLDANRLKSAFNLKLESDPKLKNQFRVDSWATNYGITDEDFLVDFKDNVQQSIDNLNTQKNQIENKINSTSNKSSREELTAQLDYLNEAITEYEGNLSKSDEDILKNRENIEFFSYKENYLNDLANVFQYQKMDAPTLEVDRGAISQMEEAGRNSRHRDAEANKDRRALAELNAKNYAAGQDALLFMAENKDDPDMLKEAYAIYANELSYVPDIVARMGEGKPSPYIFDKDGNYLGVDENRMNAILFDTNLKTTQTAIALNDIVPSHSYQAIEDKANSYLTTEYNNVETALSTVYNRDQVEKMMVDYKAGDMTLMDVESALNPDNFTKSTAIGVQNVDFDLLSQRASNAITTNVADARLNQGIYSELSPIVEEAGAFRDEAANDIIDEIKSGDGNSFVKFNTATGDGYRDIYLNYDAETDRYDLSNFYSGSDVTKFGGTYNEETGEYDEKWYSYNDPGIKGPVVAYGEEEARDLIQRVFDSDYGAQITSLKVDYTPGIPGGGKDISYISNGLTEGMQLVNERISENQITAPSYNLNLGSIDQRAMIHDLASSTQNTAKKASTNQLRQLGIGGILPTAAPEDFTMSILSNTSNIEKLSETIMSGATEETGGAETPRTTGDRSLTYLASEDGYVLDLGEFTTGKYKGQRAAVFIPDSDLSNASQSFGTTTVRELKTTQQVKAKASAYDQIYRNSLSSNETAPPVTLVPQMTIPDSEDASVEYSVGVNSVYEKDDNGNLMISGEIAVQRMVNGDNYVYPNRGNEPFILPLNRGQKYETTDAFTAATQQLLANQDVLNFEIQRAVESENRTYNSLNNITEDTDTEE